MELLKSVRLISNVLFYRLKWGHPGKVERHWENYWRTIEKTGRGLLILDPKTEARRVKALAKLYGSCPDFPPIEPLSLPES